MSASAKSGPSMPLQLRGSDSATTFCPQHSANSDCAWLCDDSGSSARAMTWEPLTNACRKPIQHKVFLSCGDNQDKGNSRAAQSLRLTSQRATRHDIFMLVIITDAGVVMCQRVTCDFNCISLERDCLSL